MATTATETARVGIYLRISRDAEGKALGVARQREDCIKKAEALGWRVVEIYDDNDVSASTLSRKPRPNYQRMMADVRAGRLDAILAYSNSRFTRRDREFSDLIDLVQDTGVIVETVVSGRANFNTADGRMVAKIMANIDAAEAERIQERVLRKHEQLRVSGAMVGARSFGYATDAAGRLTGELDEAEAALVREAADRILSGESPHRLAREWNERGITTTWGKPWTHSNLRIMLTNPKVAGYRAHKREIVRDAEGNPVMGQWTPILDARTWEKVCRRFAEKRRGRPGAVQHVLGGLVSCECDGVMWGSATKDTKTGHPVTNLVCGSCRTSISQRHVLPKVYASVAGALLIAPGETDDERTAEVSEQIETLTRSRQRLQDLVDAEVFSLAEIAAKRRDLDARIDALTAERDRLEADALIPGVVARIRREITTGIVTIADGDRFREQVAEQIKALPIDRQRTLIRGLVKITVTKARKGSRAGSDRVSVTRA